MNFKAMLFIFIYIISIHEILPVTIKIDTVTIQTGTTETSDHTKITFFADQHIRSLSEQEQITSVINFLQEQRDNHSYHILVEQASDLDKRSAIDYEILYTLDKHIEQVKPPMAHVRLDNVEIRRVAGAANSILRHYKSYKNYSEHMIENAKKTIGSITFQDIFHEFDDLKQSLASYYLNHTNQILCDIYADYIETANSYCEQLKSRIVCRSDLVLENAQAEYQNWLESNLLEERKAPNQILVKDIELTFVHLFDLNLLKNILTSDSPNILVFAGGVHTREVINMLGKLKAKTIYQAVNYVSEERMGRMGHKVVYQVEKPIAGLQITEALSAQPQEKISSYAPTICYMALAAAALYYFVSVVIPMHGYA